MDCDDEDNSGAQPVPGDDESRSAVNSLILDYYKKFGRKRDLEQYFSLSTAQSDIRDPSSSFWRNIKTEESEDSGERSDKKSESSHELCRISIRCSVPDPSSTSQDEECKTKTESVSPPIIIEEISHDSRQNSEDDALKSDDNHSQKSFDVMLDTSTNKPLSPSSSITSQRKLEWDSLADVGYANESDRKTSASSLSTLERLALKQHYSNNDTQPSEIGPPTSHSTPLEDERSKNRKGVGKKSTKIHKKDVDFLEVSVPHSSTSNPSINVNLTKHISFNVEKDGKVTVGNVQKDVSVSPEKVSIDEVPAMERIDKEIQTSLLKTKDLTTSNKPENYGHPQKIPILIGLNTLRRTRRKRFRMARRKLKTKKKSDKANISGRERSVTEQLSEAESFEYMPGHIYNQNQMSAERLSANVAGNKSSLESSAAHTTDSSKGSKHSFTKDLEKGIDLLKNALQHRCDDAELKKKLIKQVCQRLLNSQYRDDDSTTDFLSGLSFNSKKLDLDHHTTTSTSEGNNIEEKSKRPKKSILRADKFNAGSIASTSQSAPNLPVASKSDKLVTSNLTKTYTSSNTDSDLSSKDKTSSDNAGSKISSDALYQKYLQALKREEAYKRHLKDKEMFLKQKLVCSDSAFQVPAREVKSNNRLKDLINDLTRNNYDDGSGDASKLEGGPGSSRNFDRLVPNRNQRSHSVFTLSSGNSESQKKPNLKKRLQCDIKDISQPGTSKDTDTHYCCCPHHSGTGKIAFADSSVQVNINNPCADENCYDRQRISPRQGQMVVPIQTAGVTNEARFGDIKFVCHCQTKNALNDILSHNKSLQYPSDVQTFVTNNVYPCNNQNCSSSSKSPYNDKYANTKSNQPNPQIKRQAKSSQTNMLLKFLRRKSSEPCLSPSIGRSCQASSDKNDTAVIISGGQSIIIYESTRCIQTEISIDPRIAEPTLSDINIVNECECVKIISEHCRKSSKPSITDLYIPQIDAETCTISDSIKSSGTSNNGGNEYLDDVKSEPNVCETYNIDQNNLNTNYKNKPGNFTIPIQGTNMTLLVSIGSERYEFMGNKAEGLIPVSAGISEQATSILGEGFKGDQSERNGVDHNSNHMGHSRPSEIVKFDTNPKTNVIAQSTQSYGIYNSMYKERSVQIDESNKRDVQTQENVPIETQTPEYLLDYNKNGVETVSKNVQRSTVLPKHDKEFDAENNEKCPCGCGGIKEYCQVDCAGRTGNPEEPCGKLQTVFNSDLKMDNQVNTQSLVDKLKEKCPCGCEGVKENCQKDCAGRTGAPGEPCGKQSMELLSTQISFDKHNKKCSCGCEGIKENCREDCAGRKGTSGEPCGTKVLQKHDKCPCGCGGIKDNCQRDCTGRTGTPREPCGKRSLDKQLSTQNLCNKPKELCLCGCDGIKENCQYDCNGSIGEPCGKRPVDKKIGTFNLLEKLKEKCPCGCEGIKMNCPKNCARYIGTPGEPCGIQTFDKQSSTIDLIEEEIEKCPCGCDGFKHNCRKDCAGRTGMSGEPCREKVVVKKLSNKQDPLEQHDEKCQCGCAGIVKDCGEDCIGRDMIRREPCTETVLFSNQGKKCSCGCGGTKDNCQKNCVDIPVTPREGCKKQSLPKKPCQSDSPDINKKLFLENKSSSETESVDDINDNHCNKSQLNEEAKSSNCNSSRLLETNEKKTNTKNDECPCGCGNLKDNCKQNCSYSRRKKPFINEKVNVGIQKDSLKRLGSISNEIDTVNSRGEHSNNKTRYKNRKSSSETEQTDTGSDPILNLIQDITRRYSKNDIAKNKRKKCFTEIVLALNYLLETDDCNEGRGKVSQTTTPDESDLNNKREVDKPHSLKKSVDKGVQLSRKPSKTRACLTKSAEVPTSTDIPGTSSDSAACKVLNKIKKECEKYHQKRCKVHCGKKCDASSSTSIHCDQCRRVHHCSCRGYKCKAPKKSEKIQKGPIAYNLILQTSESMMSEGTACNEKSCPLKNIIVKVPKRKPVENIPFKEMANKFERNMAPCSPRNIKSSRSRSLPNESEISSMDEIMRRSRGCTVREYLEKNRPDFVEKSSQRQDCLRYVSDCRAPNPCACTPSLKMVVVHTRNCVDSPNIFCRGVPMCQPQMNNQCYDPGVTAYQSGVARIGEFCANERAVQRDLLAMYMAELPDVTTLDSEGLRRLASDLGKFMRKKKPAPKFISEREMKKHSEKIYKSLPEVVQKKEEIKKENMKKTNLLMASIFKKNLQKKTLRGSVNLSNYNTVIQI